MAVHIITSPTFEDAKREILQCIQKNNTAGTSHLVIVPDRHSLSYQRAVIEELGLVSVSNIEVASFSRIADLNIGKDKRYLTPQSAVMLMRKVINKNRSKLRRYQQSSKKVGFADEMFAVVSDIRNSNIKADAIEGKLDDISNVAVRNKISDIALLYKGYMEELETRYFDATSKFGALINIIDNIDIVRNSYVYVCDYYQFTNVEIGLLEKIMNCSKGTYISLVEKHKGANSRIFPRLSERLYNLASKNNHAVTIENKTMTPCKNSLIFDNLFGYINNERRADGKAVELVNARNVEEELSYVASNISKSIRERRLRYRDIAIAIGDLAAYKDVLATVMARYNIPYYIDDKVPVMNAPSVRHLLMALDVVANKYKRSEVISYLMNGLTTNITNDEKDIFTNYVVKYNIDRSRFTEEFTITNGEDLELLNDVRRRMLEGFDILEANNINQKMSLHIASIEEYMKAIDYVDRINAYAEKQFNAGYKVESAITTQAPKKLFKFFEELLMVAGDEEMSQREFLDILLASLARVDISLIPQFNDSVYVGDMSTSRYDTVKEMYFVGMTQGAVPQDVATRGIMGQGEVNVFESLGLNIEPSPKEKNLLARFYILELMLKGEDKIYLTYPTEGADGSEMAPSIVMKQMAEIYNMEIKKLDISTDILDYYATYDNADYLTAKNYGSYSYDNGNVYNEEKKIATYLKDKEIFEPFDYHDEERVDNLHDLYFAKYEDDQPYRMSASRIENYLKCPYKAYLQYALGLQERDVAEIKVADVGTILHRMLEILFGEEIKLSQAERGKKTDKDIKDFVYDFVYKNYATDYDSKTLHDLFNRCLYVCKKTYKMLDETKYFPVAVECRFSDHNYIVDSIKYDINGSIDRVDARDEYCYLVDYKSASNVTFKLANVYFGDRVQLVMYANMYKRIMKKNVVGLFYMPMPDSFTKVGDAKNVFKFNGIVCTDDIDNLNSDIYPIKATATKDGKLQYTSKDGEILDREQFAMVSDYVDRLVENVVKDIKNGYIAKNPLEEKCGYCSYRNLCGMFGEEINPRKIKKVDISAFAKEEDQDE